MMYSFDEILNGLLITQAALTGCYLIPALMVCGNSFAGFNAVLLGLVFVAFLTATYYVLKRELNRPNFGALLGGAATMAVITLQSAIFWGEYSKCAKPDFFTDPWNQEPGIDPQCNHRSSMGAVCAFSVLMFLSYLVQVGAMIHFKNDILAEVPFGASSYRPIPSSTQQYQPPQPNEYSGKPQSPHQIQPLPVSGSNENFSV